MKSLTEFASRCRASVSRAAASIGLGLVFSALLIPAFAADKTTPAYSYFVTGTQYFAAGNTTPIQTLPTPQPQAEQPVVLMGGGPDVDDAYRWMIQQAGITKASGGRFV